MVKYKKGCVCVMIDNKAADQLILKIASGDMTALEALYNEMAKSVFAFSMSIVKNSQMAEDVMQDTFVRIHASASGFSATGTGKAWIMQIARNLSLNAVTRRASTEPEELIAEKASADSTEDAALSKTMLSEAMNKLTDAERTVVVMHAVSGLKMEEIAATLGEPVGTVKWRHAQGLKKIRGVFSAGEEAAI